MEDNWTLSDPSGAAQELRDVADALDGRGGRVESGGEPAVVPPFALTTQPLSTLSSSTTTSATSLSALRTITYQPR